MHSCVGKAFTTDIFTGSAIPTYAWYELHYGKMKETILPVMGHWEKIAKDDDFSKTENAVEAGNRSDKCSKTQKPWGISKHFEKDIKIPTGHGMRILGSFYLIHVDKVAELRWNFGSMGMGILWVKVQNRMTSNNLFSALPTDSRMYVFTFL